MNGKTCLYKELLTVVLVVSHKLTVVALERSLEKMRRDVLTGARPELLEQNGKGLGNQAVAAHHIVPVQLRIIHTLHSHHRDKLVRDQQLD